MVIISVYSRKNSPIINELVVDPYSIYQADLQKENFFSDPAQAIAIDHLQHLYIELQTEKKPSPLFSFLFKKIESCKGLYLYGGVGRGKTYLMDLFFYSLPTKAKLRLHFHHFMLRVHKELALLQGHPDPLKKIAQKFASQARVLCFDEFYVDDIGDAMILAGMLTALFEQGVTLVATSNIHPNDLYKNGLQRPRFLPVIALLKTECEIFNLDGQCDYRLNRLIETQIYHYPLDDIAHLKISNSFEKLSQGNKLYKKSIEINQRLIPTIANSSDTLTIDFSILCGQGRGVSDYIEIAILYRTVLISTVFQMDDSVSDVTRRFISMIDEFYDHHVIVIISAEVEINQLYKGKKLQFEFKRCASRLIEMQSKAYLQQAHQEIEN